MVDSSYSGGRVIRRTSLHLQFLPEGASAKLGFYIPNRVALSTEKPAELKKTPEMTAPLYGTLSFGGKSYFLAVDEPDDSGREDMRRLASVAIHAGPHGVDVL